MQEWFELGRVSWAVVALIAVEAIVVLVIATRGPARRALLGLLPTIAAGGLLALSFAAQFARLDWRLSACLLGFAGLMHLVDMRRRWREY